MKSVSALRAGQRRLLLASVALGLLAPTAFAQEAEPQVSTIDLGQSGVALYGFTGTLEGAGTLHLTVPAEHGDDVLASLVVRDPAGAVVGIRTATPATAPEDLRGTPFAAGLPASSTELLEALTGASVRVVTPRSDVIGTVLGTGSIPDPVGEIVVDRPTVLLLDAEGRVSEVMLLPGTTVEIAEKDARPLVRAAASLTDDETQRAFDLELEGTGAREVELSYVTEAPAWKNSWRLLLEEKRLQGWATFENTSGHDWSGVTVTLSTGNPVAYRRDLLSPRRIARAEPPDLIPGQPDVRPDTGFARDGRMMAAPAPAPEAAMDMMAGAESAPVSGAANAALVLQGIDVRYLIPQGVDLAAGQTVDLLYLDLPVSPEVQALYQPLQSSNVLLAVRLSADQALAPGLVSVRDAHGFVGDAPFTGLVAGQSRLLPYAAAPGAIVTEDRTRQGLRLDLAASGGLLSLTVITQTRTGYGASLPEGVDVFAVEHPKSDARLLSSSGTVEENAGFLRITVPVVEGAAAVEVIEERVEAQQVSLDRYGAEQMLAVAAIGDIEIDADDLALVQEAAEALVRIREQEDIIDDAQARHDDLLVDQERLRANLAAVNSDELRRRYETALSTAEDEIAGLLATMDEARKAIREGEHDLDGIMKRFG